MRCTVRGMTLVEVLAATVLLALMGAVCAPLVYQATQAVAESPTNGDLIRLGELADAIVARPESFGIPDINALVDIRVQAEGYEAPVHIRLLRPVGKVGGHGWISVQLEDLIVLRWCPLEVFNEEEGM